MKPLQLNCRRTSEIRKSQSAGNLQFALQNPSFSARENSGFHARNRWFPTWKPMDSRGQITDG